MKNRSNIRKNLIFLSFLLTDFLIALQITAINSLAPKITEFYAVSEKISRWIADSYLYAVFITIFVFLLITDIFGKKEGIRKFFTEGVIYFAVGSLICYLANSFNLFIFGRIIQGLGAGMILLAQARLARFISSRNLRTMLFYAVAGFAGGIFLGNYAQIIDIFSRDAQVTLALSILGSVGSLVIISEKFQKFSFFCYVKRKRIGQILAGHGFYAITGWFFDNPLYIYVLAVYGPIRGGLVMTSLSLVICAALMVFYNRTKVDWLGMSVIEKVKNDSDKWIEIYRGRSIWLKITAFVPVYIFRILIYALKKGDMAAFLALSVFEDPFIATVYLRKGSFEKMRKKDWGIFISSVIVSNGYWITRNMAIVEIARRIIF